MSFLLIANLLSLIANGFTIASSWTKDPRRTYWYQVGQCLVYAAASWFFGVQATIIMMLINAFRNYLVASGRYTFRWMAACSIISFVVGMLISGGSIPEYISVFMTVYYTISSYYLREAKAVKINVAIDLAMWFIFDLLVTDVPSGIVDLVSVILAVITLWRIRKEETQMQQQQ